MKKLKTICSDTYGMETTKELQQLIDKHKAAIFEVAKNFAEDCMKMNIEYCSANGIFLSFAMGELTAAYGKIHCRNTKCQ